MAISEEQTVELILPCDEKHDNSRPGKTTKQEGPLHECLAVADTALRRQSCVNQRLAFLLTDVSKVSSFVQLLRNTWPQQHSKLLIGSVDNDLEWLGPVLDVIVTTPDQALEYYLNNGPSSDALKVLLIDTTADIRVQALTFAARFEGFKEFKSYSKFSSEPFSWYSPKRRIPAPTSICTRKLIPGSLVSWDHMFMAGVGDFAWHVTWFGICEWSDVPMLVPGTVRGSLNCEAHSPPLVLAPRDKVSGVVKLVHVVAALLGFPSLTIGSQEGVDVSVDCPEGLIMIPRCSERLVLIEADKLLASSESASKIQHLVKNCLNRFIGIHFSAKTKAVEELLNQVASEKQHYLYVFKDLKVTMYHVFQFFSQVDEDNADEKLDRLCNIWGQLKNRRFPVAVFCNSDDTANWVAREMRSRGIAAWVLCQGDEVDPNMYREREAVLVTSVHLRTSCNVINFDLPSTYEEYVERVGRNRDGRLAKVVINIGTHAQLAAFPPMVQLPQNCRNLHKRLSKFFPAPSQSLIGLSTSHG